MHRISLTVNILLFSLLPFIFTISAFGEEDQGDFRNFEIRAIRPRYFLKKDKIEVGSQLYTIASQTFLYSFMLSGNLYYHFNNSWALGLDLAYGTSIDKYDKTSLNEDFDIHTNAMRPESFYSGSAIWTPMYGKYQLSEGKLIYFDTFLSGGFGTSGMKYLFEQCTSPSQSKMNPGVVYYPTANVGIGQRFFVTKNSSIKWDLKDYIFSYSPSDGGCPGDDKVSNITQQFVTLQLGYSKFF